MDATRPGSSRNSGWLVLVAVALLLPMVYFASLGPVFWLCDHQWIHSDLVIVYAPLIWLSHRVAWINTLLVAYLELWQ